MTARGDRGGFDSVRGVRTTTLPEVDVEQIVAAWKSQPQEAAAKAIEQYGPPDEATPSRLIWFSRGPWRRMLVYRDPIPHRFPKPHNDLFEQVIAYHVPPDRADELAAFDGSVIVERTKGELAARCDKEEMNYLALNLAHEVVTGQRGVDEARRFYTVTAAKFMMGQDDAYTQGLVFDLPTEDVADPDAEQTADSDEITVGETMLHKAGEKLGLGDSEDR